MRKARTQKKTILTGLVAALMLGMTGCGSSGSVSYNTTAAYDAVADAGFYEEAVYEYEYDTAVSESAASSADAAVSDRKLIKTVNMTVETEEYDRLVDLLYQKVDALGGYTEYFSTQGAGTDRYGSMTARIPKENLDTFLETVEGASNITYRQENVEDVTLSYVDLESHKKMLLKEQERLLELIEEAETIEDIITLESRLTEVQYQLESMETQLRTYDNRIEYSTVYLDINEVVRYTPQEQKGTWDRIRTGFMENLYAVGDGLADFFIGLVIHIPNILLFLIVIGIIALIVRLILGMEKKASVKKQKKKMQEQQVYMQQGPVQHMPQTGIPPVQNPHMDHADGQSIGDEHTSRSDK